MSWYSDAVDAVDSVADAIEDGTNAAGEFVSDIVESVGNAIEDGLDAAADVPVLGSVLGWVGAVVSSVFDLVGSVVKAVFGIVGGVIGGVVRIIGGIVGLSWNSIVRGLGDIFSSIFGGVAGIVTGIADVINAIIGVKARRLTKAERELLGRVFEGSVALYNVRLVEGWSGFYAGARPVTIRNTIYLKERDVASEPHLLVHECTHVWQYQNTGARYMTDALWAQATMSDEYSWEAEIGRGKDDWWEWNLEAQAEFLGASTSTIDHDLYTGGDLTTGGTTTHGNGVFYDADGKESIGTYEVVGTHTDRAHRAIKNVREDRSQRLSSWF